MSQSRHPDAYIVRKNDNLSNICQFLYGASYRWRELAAVNQIEDPTQLRTGTPLSVPSDGLIGHPRPYKIQKHDTYCELAARYLGAPTRWPELAKLNAVQPTELRTGMEVRVPADFRNP
jgi:nucleoid-associated protein YgaU